jgi:hypothetical protein
MTTRQLSEGMKDSHTKLAKLNAATLNFATMLNEPPISISIKNNRVR